MLPSIETFSWLSNWGLDQNFSYGTHKPKDLLLIWKFVRRIKGSKKKLLTAKFSKKQQILDFVQVAEHEGEPMRIVYRMRGLLGDATEEFIEKLDTKSDKDQDPEEVCI